MTAAPSSATPPVPTPTFEHHAPGRLGIGERTPRLSWQVPSAAPGYRQHAAEVQLTVENPDGSRRVTTHAFTGPEQILLPWPADPLRSRQSVTARVRVNDGSEWGPWSEPGRIESGLFEGHDWVAQFVGPAGPDAEYGRPPGRVRSEFVIAGEPRHARLCLSAMGLAEAEINGLRVGDEELTPGWTSYRHRLRYATFDVTELVSPGPNAIGIWLGDGWWRGRLGFGGGVAKNYGDVLGALVQLEITFADGTRQVVATDETWLAGPGPIQSSGLYEGERFDARAHDPAWSRPGFSTEGWSPVEVHRQHPPLIAPQGPPVRCTEELRPVEVFDKGNGRWIVDFGQNHSGRLRLRARGHRGQEITLRHAEILQDGELCVEPLRTATATDVLVLDGGEIEWEPRFTLHGYRYAEITGWTGKPDPEDIVSRVIHSDMPRTGWFRSSEPLVNQLHENVVWSLRSNFVDIPTDCPQRDERLGWTGDLQVFAPTAAFLYDVTGFLSSWLSDLALEQEEYDWVPPYVPYIPLDPFASLPRDPMAVWGDVAVLTPDVLHRSSGDLEVLRRQLASAVQWMEQVERSAGPGRICHDTEQFGDWLDPAAPPENPFEATTDPYLVATAYFAHSARRLAAIARVLGERQLNERYTALAQEVREAYARQYIRDDGRLTSDSQTAYALTTVFDLWPSVAAREAGAERLAELVRHANGRIATGFAGTPVTTDALSVSGHVAEAYQLLQHEECPSWLYPVRMGATTTWERWDSLKPDGTVNSPTMTSFNHYALGAVASWLHRVVAGIEPAEPGYRRIRFAPRPGGTLTSAGATHMTPYGEASIDWVLDDGILVVDIVVPTGTTAIVDLPDGCCIDVEHGRHRVVANAHADADRRGRAEGIEPSDALLQAFVGRLGLEDKVALLTGQDSWSLRAMPSIGLRSIVMSDGPAGVRGPSWDEREPSVSFPSPTAVAASWDRTRARQVGYGLGSEARRKSVDVVLGPTINVQRSPYGGRHFEAFSEDPVLTSELATSYVQGIQSHGVGATVKHYVANDSETDRFTVNVVADERTLRENYLLAFEGPVVDGRAWLVMSAYNSINGITATESPLLTTPLRDEWGFDGVVVSDWTAVRSIESARHPQDVAMPGPEGAWGDRLVAAVLTGEVDEREIDRKVVHILRLAARVGALDGFDARRSAEPAPARDVRHVARAAAVDGMVLLANDGILPLTNPGRIAVIGEGARVPRTQGGGSATVIPERVLSPLDEIAQRWPHAQVTWSLGAVVQRGLAPLDAGTFATPDGQPGMQVRYFDADGRLVGSEVRESSSLVWFDGSSLATRATTIEFALRYTPPSATNEFPLAVAGVADADIIVDGKMLTSMQLRTGPGDDPASAVLNPPWSPVTVPMTDASVDLLVRYHPVPCGIPDSLALRLGTPPTEADPEALIVDAAQTAAAADVAIVVVSTSNEVESEGFDRESLRLPGHQDCLVRAVAGANPRTIVVVNTGAPVLLPWRNDVAAVLAVWFPGQEFGPALADVLSGLREPGGRTPVTWPADEHDVPVSNTKPDMDGNLQYVEGIHIGDRAWRRAKVVPAYAFGHGFGYTSWRLYGFHASPLSAGGASTVTVAVENCGERAGKCVVQIYAERPLSRVDRPARWLVGFETIHLGAGETASVTIDLSWRRFAHWENGAWHLETGQYRLIAGLASDNDACTTTLIAQ